MLYSLSKDIAPSLMKAPTKPPDPPLGSHGDIDDHDDDAAADVTTDAAFLQALRGLRNASLGLRAAMLDRSHRG